MVKGERNKEGMTGRINIRLTLLLFIPLLMLYMYGCRQINHFSAAEQIPESGWQISNRIGFDVEITDTLSAFDIFFTLRNNNDYPFRNLYLFITVVSPEGYAIKDTLEYQLSDEKGNWFGSGLGDIHDLTVPFKRDVLFPESGSYRFIIEHGMREEELKGIIDIGIRIRYHKE